MENAGEKIIKIYALSLWSGSENYVRTMLTSYLANWIANMVRYGVAHRLHTTRVKKFLRYKADTINSAKVNS